MWIGEVGEEKSQVQLIMFVGRSMSGWALLNGILRDVLYLQESKEKTIEGEIGSN